MWPCIFLTLFLALCRQLSRLNQALSMAEVYYNPLLNPSLSSWTLIRGASLT
jgi:hypothetical protein